LKGFAEVGDAAHSVGLPAEVVEVRLRTGAEDGFVQHRSGSRSGWSLTAEGRKEGERLLAEELDSAGRRPDVTAAYWSFRGLNRAMLAVCTAWQVRDGEAGILNDHSDEVYDRAVVARLTEVDGGVQPICALLGGWFDRFDRYGPRFGHALGRVLSGERDWFTRPTIDSYHTVWFELHEDLLATLGIDRGSEPTDPAAAGST
jgi:hypothetical protein